MKRFAAFVMTYRRNEKLKETVQKLFHQSLPPEKILIVDNDPQRTAESILQELTDSRLTYDNMGYNAGPAGAAKKGLELLAAEGFQWIAWIDDDDPPVFENTFEVLLNMAEKQTTCGCAGVVGQRLDRHKGLLVRFGDDEIEGAGALQVDSIAGNMYKIINGDVVRSASVLPDSGLFFGFEELDFDLSLQSAGFSLFVDKEQFRKHREYFKRSGAEVKRGRRKDLKKLWREYYSIRNSLIIFRKNKMWFALFQTMIRSIFKLIAGFRFGLTYGIRHSVYVNTALIHFATRKSGKTISPR